MDNQNPQDNANNTTPDQAPTPTPQAPQPAAETPAPAAPPATPETPPAEPAATPQPQPTEQAAPAQQPAEVCKCDNVEAAEWDKKRLKLGKMFYKTFSPKLFYYPFSFAVDLNRAKVNAEKKGYKIPEKPMVLEKSGMFWGSVMIEVEGANTNDKNVVSLMDQEVYTKASIRPWKEIKQDIDELELELGTKPKELYFWYTACPKCVASKQVKTVLIAVPAAAQSQPAPADQPEQAPAPQEPTTPASEQAAPPAQPQQPETPPQEEPPANPPAA